MLIRVAMLDFDLKNNQAGLNTFYDFVLILLNEVIILNIVNTNCAGPLRHAVCDYVD